MNSSVENLCDLKLRRLLADFHHSGKGAFLMRKWLPATRTKCKILRMTPLVMPHNSVPFRVAYEKIGTIQRRALLCIVKILLSSPEWSIIPFVEDFLF